MSYYDSRGGGGRGYYADERRDDRYADDYPAARPSRDLVPRHRDSDMSVEEVRRDFPPPGYGSRARGGGDYYYDDDYDGRSDSGRSRHHSHRPRGGTSVYYEEEERKRQRVLSRQQKIIAAVAGGLLAAGGKELYDRREAHGEDVHRNPLASAALAAGGAFAAYQGAEAYNKYASKDQKSTYVMHKGRDGRIAEAYYSDEDDDRSEKEKKGHKNFLESALAAAGVGGALKALTGGGKDDDKHSDTRSRHGSDSSRRDGEKGGNKIQQAAMASLIAGATEAFRVAKEPGNWQGEKAKRVFTAAASAAAVDGVHGDKHPKMALAESVIAGLGVNRVLNGSRKNIEKDEVTGRSRSRSRASGSGGGGGGATGLAALATAGLGALGAKKLYDNTKDSRSRSRGRSPSDDGSPDRRRNRSRSVVDRARDGLAKLGIGGGDRDDDRDDRSRGGSRRPSSRGPSRRYDSGDEYDDQRSHRGGGRDRGYDDDDRSRNGGGRDRARGGGNSRRSSKSGTSDSDLGDSSEDEKRAKKMRGKQILTTGLAAVATIHAAHNVYQSMEKRNARHKAVQEGRLSKEEAAKLKSKAMLQDAASVGIAALGIKGALSEMKEVREMAHERKEWEEEKEHRHAKRLERQKRHRERQLQRSDSRDSYDRYNDGPRYIDGNPYAAAALPAPPVGYYNDERR